MNPNHQYACLQLSLLLHNYATQTTVHYIDYMTGLMNKVWLLVWIIHVAFMHAILKNDIWCDAFGRNIDLELKGKCRCEYQTVRSGPRQNI